MRKIKILHVIDNLVFGGAERRLVSDVINLDKSRFENLVCVLGGENVYKDELGQSGERIIHLNIGTNDGFFRLIKILLGKIKSENPDIIHSHLFKSNLCARIAGKLAGCKNILNTVHATEHLQAGDHLDYYSFKRKWADFFSAKYGTKAMIAVSNYVADYLKKEFDFKNIKVIYNYLEDKWFSQTSEPSEASGDRMIFSSGRLLPQKGYQFLIKALPKVLERHNDLKLLIAGDGNFKKELLNYISELGIDSEKVEFLGERQDIRGFIKKCTLFIFPSVCEGFGISLLEAMSQAKPCVAFNFGPIPELIKDGITGYLANYKDPNDLAEKIIYVLDNPEQASKIGKNAADFAQANFKKEKYVKELENYYIQILSNEDFNPSTEISGFQSLDECCAVSGGNPERDDSIGRGSVTNKKGAPDFGSTFAHHPDRKWKDSHGGST